MKRFAIFLSGLALAALPCTSALADDLNFNFSGSMFSGSGALTFTNATGLITSAKGTVAYNGTNYSIALLPVNNFAGNDNLFSGNTSIPFDFNGVGLSLVGSNNIALSLYNVPPSPLPYELLGINGGPQIGTENASFNATVTATPTVTPEPGSLALLGTGALGAFGVLRRKLAV